jgi:hypothetical protein
MRPLWSQTIPAPLQGLVLARERAWVLAWEGNDGLHLFGQGGKRQALIRTPAAISRACCSDNGSRYAIAASATGQVWLLAPDLTVCWERVLPQPATALALDPLGEYLVAADRAGQVYLIDQQGRRVWHAASARPLHHLAFVPEKPLLVGTADFGLVVCFDARGRLLWRDGLASHVGSLAVSGDGAAVVLACFSDGLCCYAHDRGTPQRLPLDVPCHLAAVSYSGQLLLTASPGRVSLRRPDGTLCDHFLTESAPVALALGPQKDPVVLGFSDGKVLCLEGDGECGPA